MAAEKEMKTVLTIAGSDSSGGAGLQMDLKCFAALGVHGCSAVTAVTAQNTARVGSVQPLSPRLVREQLDVVFEDFTIDAAKTGMLYEAAIVEAVAAKLAEEGTPLVVDPVLTASVGAALSSPDLVDALRERLLPKAFLVTPNIPEAAELTGSPVRGDDGMRRACLELFQLGSANVLLKGGHLTRGPPNDLFYDGAFHLLEGERISRRVHGTGCMLSAFITALLAKGILVSDAVGLAKRYVTEAIRFGEELGRGRAVGNPLTILQNSAQRYHVVEEVHRWSGELEDLLPLSLVPEVGINLAFGLPYATSLEEVCALEGRIVRAGRRLRRVGIPSFGASRHVATVVLTAMRHDRRFRCAVNLRYSKPLIDLSRTLGFKTGSFDRRNEPKEARSTIEWGTDSAIRSLGFVPDMIYDEGGVGKEPMIRLLGWHPMQVVEKVRTLVKGLKEGH